MVQSRTYLVLSDKSERIGVCISVNFAHIWETKLCKYSFIGLASFTI
jgi:hypothetical protein